MIQITNIPVPGTSLIAKSVPVVNYSDCYHGQFHSEKNIELKDCIDFFLFRWPWWVHLLLKIRNILVAPLGLKSDKEYHPPDKINKQTDISKGACISFFEIWDCNKNEILLSMRDKHLDAFSSVILEKHDQQYEIFLSTTVIYHNALGSVYFFLIKPFHTLIIRTQLSRMVKHYSNQTETHHENES